MNTVLHTSQKATSLCKYTHIHHAYFGFSLFEALISDSIGVYVAIGSGGKTPVEDHVAVVVLNHIQTLWHGGYWREGKKYCKNYATNALFDSPYIYDARHHAHPYRVSTTVLSDISYAFLSC